MDAECRANRRPRRVSASELAQMAICERRVLLEHRFGKRTSHERRRAMLRGQSIHRRILKGRRPKAGRWRWIWSLIDWIRCLFGGPRSGGGGK